MKHYKIKPLSWDQIDSADGGISYWKTEFDPESKLSYYIYKEGNTYRLEVKENFFPWNPENPHNSLEDAKDRAQILWEGFLQQFLEEVE